MLAETEYEEINFLITPDGLNFVIYTINFDTGTTTVQNSLTPSPLVVNLKFNAASMTAYANAWQYPVMASELHEESLTANVGYITDLWYRRVTPIFDKD